MRTLLSASLLAVALALTGCESTETKADAETPPAKKSKLTRFTFTGGDANSETGVKLPGEEEATLVGQDGKLVRVSDFKGKPLVVVFMRGFAGFICPFCTTYTAQIATRYDELKGLGAEVLLVYPTKEAETGKVEEFVGACNEILEEEGKEALPFPVFLDPGLKVVKRYRLEGDLSKPSTFVLDAEGTVRYAYVGEAKDDRPPVDRIVKEVSALKSGQ